MARTESNWKEINGSYLQTPWAEGRDILINGTNKYLNFASISGSSGYGFRDNGGVMEVKDLSGAWNPIGDAKIANVWANGSATSNNKMTVSATPPTDPALNDLWIDIS